MVIYKLRRMKSKTLLIFLALIWLFSAFCAISGSSFIVFTTISSKTPFNVRENQIIGQIWHDLGSFQGYQVPNGTGYPIWGTIDKEAGKIYFIDNEDSNRTSLYELPAIFIELQNGSAHYDNGDERLVFIFFNGTQYECKSPRSSLGINIITKRFQLNYRQDIDQVLIKTRIIGKEGEDQTSSIEKFSYFDVKYRNIIDAIGILVLGMINNFVPFFFDIGYEFLFSVAIGGGIGITTAIILSIFRITRIGGGKKWSYFILRCLLGRIGRLLSHIPFFNFSGDYFIEESIINTIDFSSIRLTFSELFSKRLYDIFFFPPLLASSIMYLFIVAGIAKGYLFLVSGPLVAPIVLILLTFYYPIVWQLDEAGIKKMNIGSKGDIISLKPFGNIIRDGLGVIIGFSGIISVAAFGIEITNEFNIQGQTEFVGISFDWFGFLLLVLMTIGMFLILASSTIVGAVIIAIAYLQTSHINSIESLRVKCEQNKLISNFGSTLYQFSPTSRELIIQKEK